MARRSWTRIRRCERAISRSPGPAGLASLAGLAGRSMRRREFIAGLACTAAGWPQAARAQSGNIRRIGVLMNAAANEPEPQSYLSAFSDGLRELGWVDGRTVRIDVRWNAGSADLARTYAAQLIGLMPDVILVGSTTNLITMQQATNIVPIVFVQTTDPVAQGFVPNLTRPGGNITGFFGTEFSIGGNGWTCSSKLRLVSAVSPSCSIQEHRRRPSTMSRRSRPPLRHSACKSLQSRYGHPSISKLRSRTSRVSRIQGLSC